MSDTVASAPSTAASTEVDSDVAASLQENQEHEQSQQLEPPILPPTKITTAAPEILFNLVAFRIVNALSIKTFFQPDEYFQSLEPAWQMAFGKNSGAWITWEWKYHLRSSIHPYIFAVIYWLSARLSEILQLSPGHRAELLVAAPKLLQALIAAGGDYYTWKLADRVYGKGNPQAWTALALTVCSAWQWFCSTRTLSNSLETTITIAALESWPWHWSLDAAAGNAGPEQIRADSSFHATKEQGHEDNNDEQSNKLRRCLLLAALACIMRPTNILIWASLTCLTLFRVTAQEKLIPWKWPEVPVLVTVRWPALLRATKSERYTLIREAAICGTLVLAISALFDRAYYEQWTFPPFRFIHFNIAQALAVFYGSNRWDYYLTEGYPLLLTTYLPFGLMGLYQALKSHPTKPDSPLGSTIRSQLAAVALVVPLILSFISHKEVRFIYPLLPILHILAANSVWVCFKARSTSSSRYKKTPYLPQILVPLILGLNIFIGLFTTKFHQVAPLAVMSYLRHEHEAHYLTQPPPGSAILPADEAMTVGFLMPCHSTPWRSHLVHPGIKAWALGCEPPVYLPVGPARDSYLDEADQFYADPPHFLLTNLGRPRKQKSLLGGKKPMHGLGEDIAFGAWDGTEGRKLWPEYLVFFEGLEETLDAVVKDAGYQECWRGWNSFGHDDWRRKGDVLVWCLRGVGERVRGWETWWGGTKKKAN